MEEKRPNHVRRRRRRKKGNWFTRLKTWQKIVFCLVVVLFCLVGSAVLYVAAKWNKINTQEINAEDLIINQGVQKNEEIDLGSGYKNVALFGVDSRDNELGEGTRSDTIMIASLNRETLEVKISSVYRDTLLQQSDGTLNHGDQYAQHEPGP